MDIHVYHHFDFVRDDEVNEKLDNLIALMKDVRGKERLIMATLDQVLADVTDETNQIDGISTLIAGLKKQLADVLSGTVIPPAVQAKVDSIFAAAETNKAKIADALNANVEPAPAP